MSGETGPVLCRGGTGHERVVAETRAPTQPHHAPARESLADSPESTERGAQPPASHIGRLSPDRRRKPHRISAGSAALGQGPLLRPVVLWDAAGHSFGAAEGFVHTGKVARVSGPCATTLSMSDPAKPDPIPPGAIPLNAMQSAFLRSEMAHAQALMDKAAGFVATNMGVPVGTGFRITDGPNGALFLVLLPPAPPKDDPKP